MKQISFRLCLNLNNKHVYYFIYLLNFIEILITDTDH